MSLRTSARVIQPSQQPLRARAGAGPARAAGGGHGARDGRPARGAHPRDAHGHGADVARGAHSARERRRLPARGRVPAHWRACGPVLLVACWFWSRDGLLAQAGAQAPYCCLDSSWLLYQAGPRHGRPVGTADQGPPVCAAEQALCLRRLVVELRGGCRCGTCGIRAHTASARARAGLRVSAPPVRRPGGARRLDVPQERRAGGAAGGLRHDLRCAVLGALQL